MHKWKPDDPLRAPWLNEAVAALNRSRRPALRVDRAPPIWGTLSGSSSPYTFTAAVETSSAGAWSAGPRTGTAYEVNGKSGLGGTVQRLYPDRFGKYRFQSIRYGTTGGGGIGSLPGCICVSPPATLYMTVTGGSCNNGLLNDCTIQYGPTPSSLSGLRLGVNCYLSTTTFTDSQTGDSYYYYLGCFGAVMRISRVFPTSVFGSPFLDSVIYYWSVGLSGNTCVPFLLSNGQIYSGGDPACSVTISE